jgi:hypothetical protein
VRESQAKDVPCSSLLVQDQLFART